MSKDLVDTKSTLEKEHKLVVLQMQAINELWKKVIILHRLFYIMHICLSQIIINSIEVMTVL